MTIKNLQQVRDEAQDLRTSLLRNYGAECCFHDSTYNGLGKIIATLDSIMGDYGWQPIETHDKGKVKCLWGVWKDGKWYETLGTYGKNFNGSYPLVSVGFRNFELPTHWMPLPAAPKHGGSDGNKT